MCATPSSLMSSSAGTAPTQDSQAGETSRRLASDASAIPGPYTDSQGSGAAYHPAELAGTAAKRSARTVMNAEPRGDSSHLYAPHTMKSMSAAAIGNHPQP